MRAVSPAKMLRDFQDIAENMMIIKSPSNGDSMNGPNKLGTVPQINSRNILTRGGSIRVTPLVVNDI